MLHFSLAGHPPMSGPPSSTDASNGCTEFGVRQIMRHVPPASADSEKQKSPSAQSFANVHVVPSVLPCDERQPAVPSLSSSKHTLPCVHGSCLNGLQRSRYEQTKCASLS